MTAHHSVRIYANYGEEDHGRKTVTGYALHHPEKHHTSVCVVSLLEPDTKDAAIRKMCKLLREGWFITNIFYSETSP
jgi:hypothetical protein